MSLVRVLEIGGTHVTAATVDADEHRVRARTRTALDSGASADGILATLSGAAMLLADTVATPWAVAIPDPFDYEHGIGLFRDVGKFDALYGVDVGRALLEAISPQPQSITFTHDTEAFLLGEWLSGAAQGARRCAAVTLGTGVGSAFLDDGTIVRSGPGIPPDGRIHRLTVDGAPLEDTVSRRAIRARYATRAGADLDVHQIADLARRGDPVAAAVLEHAFCSLGRALAPIMRDFAPDVLVIGGSIAGSWELLIGPLTQGLELAGVRGADIRPAAHEADSGVIGAARQAVARHVPIRKATTLRPTKRPAGAHRCGAAAAAPESADTTRGTILRWLASADVVERLAAYYAPGNDACGTNFLDGTEGLAPDEITPADLFAVTTLGLELPNSVARRLLRDRPQYAEIASCLALDRLPTGVSLDEATPEILEAMRELHDAVHTATQDQAVADALCARKRPELFAPFDEQSRAALHLPITSGETWAVLSDLMSDDEVQTELERIFQAVRRQGTETDVQPLRQICVLAELSSVHP